MKVKQLFASLMALGCLLLAPSAHAALWTIQPSVGHVWNGNGTLGGFQHIDGQIRATTNGTWVVPVQLSAYNVTYNGIQNTSVSLGGVVNSRLAAFDKDGAFVGATGGSTETSIGSILVPINGTLFFQSTFTAGGCSPSVPFCPQATLRSLKLTY